MSKGTKEAFLATVIDLFELIKRNDSEQIKAFLAAYDNDPFGFYAETLNNFTLNPQENELLHICYSLLQNGKNTDKIAECESLIEQLSLTDPSEKSKAADMYAHSKFEKRIKNLTATMRGDASTIRPSETIPTFKTSDHLILEDDQVSPSFMGIALVTQYWFQKYAVICQQLTETDMLENFLTRVSLMQKELQQENPSDDFRASFIVNLPGTVHFFPVIYIKENGSEAVLIPDSVAGKSELEFAKALSKKFPSIPVFVVNEVRQADHFSCKTDALVFCRDTTAQLPNGTYRVPDLLKKLERRSTPVEGNVSSVLLPDELLKTAQRNKFVASHTESSEKKVHKQETLSDFRKRYTCSFFNPMRPDDPAKNISSYLTDKGRQLTKNMIIQFYINALTASGYEWSEEKKNDFIRDAKFILSDAFKDKRHLDKQKLDTAVTQLHSFVESWQAENRTLHAP